ncbi:Tubulin-specific chaperone E like protein, partial [Aduncisulcus paluster]
MHKFSVGERVSNDKYCGTVRYVGPIAGTKSDNDFIGVEWDNDGAGKYNGTFKGKEYFKCKDGRGAFLKPRKLNEPISLVRAIRKKYHESQLADEGREQLRAMGVEFVGAKEAAKHVSLVEYLTAMGFQHEPINCIGDKEELKKMLQSLTSLDVSFGLLTSWVDFETICSCAPHLSYVFLNGNKLGLREDSFLPHNLSTPEEAERKLNELFGPMLAEYDKMIASGKSITSIKSIIPDDSRLSSLRDNFKGITHLLIQDTGLSSDAFYALPFLFSSLEEIRAERNDIPSFLAASPTGHRLMTLLHSFQTNFTSLHLNHNPLSSWEDIIEHVGQIRTLRTLALNDTKLGDFDFEAYTCEMREKDPSFVVFPELDALKIDNINITSWKTLESLLSLPDTPLTREALFLAQQKQGGDDEGEKGTTQASSLVVSRDNKVISGCSCGECCECKWSRPSIDYIVPCPHLFSLTLNSIPLFSTLDAAIVRAMIVSRLPQVGVLNKSTVRFREKKEARASLVSEARNIYMQLKMDFAVSGEKDKVADTVSNLDTTVSDTIQAVCGTQVYYYAQMFDIMLPRVCYPLGHVQRQRIVDESAEKEGTIEVILRYVEIGPDGKEKNDIGADMKVDDEEEKPTLFEGEKEKEGEEEGEKGTKDSIEKEEEAENEYEYYDEEEDSVHEDDIVRDDITKKLPISFS